MKKYLLVGLVAFLSLGVMHMSAQTTPKKKKKKKTENKVNTDSIAAARAADSLAKIAAATPPPPPAPEDNPFADLVSNDTGFANDFTLDTAKPVDGYYKQTN